MQKVILSILKRDEMYMKFGNMSYHKFKIRRELLMEILNEIHDEIE